MSDSVTIWRRGPRLVISLVVSVALLLALIYSALAVYQADSYTNTPRQVFPSTTPAADGR